MSDQPLALSIPETLIEAIARRVLEILSDQQPAAGHRWLTGAQACAEYLGCSPKRVYNRLHEIPHARDGGRLMFNTRDLDEWLRSQR